MWSVLVPRDDRDHHQGAQVYRAPEADSGVAVERGYVDNKEREGGLSRVEGLSPRKWLEYCDTRTRRLESVDQLLNGAKELDRWRVVQRSVQEQAIGKPPQHVVHGEPRIRISTREDIVVAQVSFKEQVAQEFQEHVEISLRHPCRQQRPRKAVSHCAQLENTPGKQGIREAEPRQDLGAAGGQVGTLGIVPRNPATVAGIQQILGGQLGDVAVSALRTVRVSCPRCVEAAEHSSVPPAAGLCCALYHQQTVAKGHYPQARSRHRNKKLRELLASIVMRKV